MVGESVSGHKVITMKSVIRIAQLAYVTAVFQRAKVVGDTVNLQVASNSTRPGRLDRQVLNHVIFQSTSWDRRGKIKYST